MQTAMRQASAATNRVASLRVKPFTAVISTQRPARGTIKASAAEVQASAPEDDFSFSFSDAKKQNEYTAGDVEAALRYYTDGEGSQPAADLDFVDNPLGMEDASFFDDVDNNEAYEADEYVVAGIPEAAPKKRRGGRRGEGADGDDENDEMVQAKALDKVKAMEDRMVLEAALEEDFGGADAEQVRAPSAGKPLGVWDWLTDFEADAYGNDQELEEARAATKKLSAAPLMSDSEVAAAFALVNPEVLDNEEVKDFVSLFGADDVNEDVLTADFSDDGVDPESTITDEELARLDAVISTQIPSPELQQVPASDVPYMADEPELDRGVVDSYIETLRNAMSAKAEVSEEEVRAMFEGEPLVQEKPDEEAEDLQEYQQLLAAPAEDPVEAEFDFEAQAAAIADQSDEVALEDDQGFERELASLAAVEEFTEADIPSEEALGLLEEYVVAAEDFVATEEARKADIAGRVARGELSADALAEDLEELPDAVGEMLEDIEAQMAEEGDDFAVAGGEEEEDGENWVERIIELTRVTKVVKGGKIMGFRCVTVVGNQNGLVGVGCQAGREVAVAVKRALVDAKKNVVRVPLVGAGTVPHRAEAKYHAARCLVLPASDGTGCIAGGSVRSVLELAGVKNCLAKRIGSRSALNSARATVKALQSMQSLYEVSQARGVPLEQLLLPK